MQYRACVNTLALITLQLLSLPAHAHEDPMPFEPAPVVLNASLAIGGVGLLLLVGLMAYRAATLRRQPNGAETASPRWFSRALFGLFALTLMAGSVFFFAQRSLNAAEHERQELHGNAMEAMAALSERLEQTPENERTPMLLSFAREKSPGLRLAAINALGDLRTPEAAETLEAAFQDSSASVRERAMELLPDTDKERGAKILLAALSDDDTLIREMAVRKIISLLGRKSASFEKSTITSLLYSLLRDPSPDVVDAATIALSKVTGRPWRIKKTMSEEERKGVIKEWEKWGKGNVSAHAMALSLREPLPPTRRDPAPDFRLTDSDGKPLTLSEQQGKITMLNFWGTWCAPCRQEIPDLKKVDEAYRSRGVTLVGLVLSEPEGEAGVRRFCDKNGLRYRQAICTRAVQRDYGEVTEVPVTVLIDKAGDIRYRWEGPRDFATFRTAIERLLAEP
jgi:peroxiredoxin